MAIKIAHVDINSPAARIGIAPGDRIIFLNLRRVRDFLDLQFETSESRLTVEWIDVAGNSRSATVRKRPETPFGAEPEQHRCRTCANRCMFCFVDQTPPDARESLRIKDDDPAFSFVFGNFITLTNMVDDDFQRIIAQRRSPLYISVHATNPQLHRKLIGYRHPFDLMARLRELSEAGIDLHTQIVVVPGMNDGTELRRTLSDLSTLSGVISVGLVPVGLTRFREGLPVLPLVDAACARECLEIAEEFNTLCDEPWVFGADEMYLKAGIDVPPAEFYGDFEQIENGIGMIRSLREHWAAKQEEFFAFLTDNNLSLRMITGVSAESEIANIAQTIRERLGEDRAEQMTVKNLRMGETVTVAGLLGAGDILSQYTPRGNAVATVPSTIFNFDGVTLDDMPREELRDRLGGRLLVVDELFRDWELL